MQPQQEYFPSQWDKPNFLKTSNFVLEIRNIFLFQEIYNLISEPFSNILTCCGYK